MVPNRSIAVALKKGIAVHFLQELANKRLPGASLLYDARINLDLCSMLFSRQFVLNPLAANDWVIHLRCDSSPQFGRDYLVSQIDIVQVGLSYDDTIITKRLLPIQCVGSRAGSAPHKIEKLIFALSLESSDVTATADRTCSILTDYGTESLLWFTPREGDIAGAAAEAETSEDLFLFRWNLPLPDGDHSLHHIMETMSDHGLYDQDSLASLSRWFSLRSRCDRFVALCIYRNQSIQTAALKKSFASLFKLTCPTLVSSRWNYIYDVLAWLLPRQQALEHLAADLQSQTNDSFTDFSEKELRLMLAVTCKDSGQYFMFWASCCLSHELACWGASVSSYLHSCPVHDWNPGHSSCNCQFKGRMGCKLAQGLWLDDFSTRLMNLPFSKAEAFLDKLTIEDRNSLLQQYQACKVSMVQRFLQVYDFWKVLPWRALAMGTVLFCETTLPAEVLSMYAASSKAYASEILLTWDSHNTAGGRQFSHNVTRKFLDPSFPDNLRFEVQQWSQSTSNVMPPKLARTLMQYCSALTVMQMLEGQHHYLNMQVAGARASLPASTCALLRRRCNQDLNDPRFRKNLSHYMRQIPKLVPFDWDSRRDLIRYVYGFSLDMMYKDVTQEAEQLEAAKLALQSQHFSSQAHSSADGPSGPSGVLNSQERSIRNAHIHQRLVEGCFYRVKTPTPTVSSEEVQPEKYIAFQCICLNPGKRSYVQRVCYLGKDLWTDSIAVNVCGSGSKGSLETVDCQFLGLVLAVCCFCIMIMCFGNRNPIQWYNPYNTYMNIYI